MPYSNFWRKRAAALPKTQQASTGSMERRRPPCTFQQSENFTLDRSKASLPKNWNLSQSTVQATDALAKFPESSGLDLLRHDHPGTRRVSLKVTIGAIFLFARLSLDKGEILSDSHVPPNRSLSPVFKLQIVVTICHKTMFKCQVIKYK